MKVYCKQALLFEQGEKSVRIPHEYIGNLPDWVKDTPMYKLAIQSGLLSVITNREQEIVAANGDAARLELMNKRNIADLLGIEGAQEMDEAQLDEALGQARETLKAAGEVTAALEQKRQRAKDLGVKNYQRMGEAKLDEAIAAAELAADEANQLDPNNPNAGN